MEHFDQEICPQCKFNYEGFEALDSEKRTVQIAMGKILSEAPSKSHCEVSFKKNGNLLFGAISIQSIQGNFDSFGESEKIESLIFSMQDEMLTKLNDWKRTRFL